MNRKKANTCPVCGIEIRNQANLERHMKARHADDPGPPMASMRFPGASHAVGDAPLPTVSSGSHDMPMLFDHIRTQTQFPCVCSSCCIRSIAGYFLPSLLESRFGGTFESVASGIPIPKKSGEATCVDFLVFRTAPETEWWLVDLVFQPDELRARRIKRYVRACETGMSGILKALTHLREDSPHEGKHAFRRLIRAIRTHDTKAPVRLAIILPARPDSLDSDGIELVTWGDLHARAAGHDQALLLDLVEALIPADSASW